MPLVDDTRSAWGALPNTNPRKVPRGDRIGVSWHYPGGTAPGFTADHSRCLAQVKEWQRQHQAKGWSDIGYNFLVCVHARAIEGRGLDYQGAHSPGVNYQHVGVQIMVPTVTGTPTAAMYARAARLDADLRALCPNITREWGHRDDPQAATSCPGDVIEAWVKAGGPRKTTSTTPPTPIPEEPDMPTAKEIAAEVMNFNTGQKYTDGKPVPFLGLVKVINLRLSGVQADVDDVQDDVAQVLAQVTAPEAGQ